MNQVASVLKWAEVKGEWIVLGKNLARIKLSLKIESRPLLKDAIT